MDILFNSIKAKHLSKRGIIKFINQFQREQLLLNTYYFARLLNAIERDGNEFVNGFGSKSNKIPIDILKTKYIFPDFIIDRLTASKSVSDPSADLKNSIAHNFAFRPYKMKKKKNKPGWYFKREVTLYEHHILCNSNEIIWLNKTHLAHIINQFSAQEIEKLNYLELKDWGRLQLKFHPSFTKKFQTFSTYNEKFPDPKNYNLTFEKINNSVQKLIDFSNEELFIEKDLSVNKILVGTGCIALFIFYMLVVAPSGIKSIFDFIVAVFCALILSGFAYALLIEKFVEQSQKEARSSTDAQFKKMFSDLKKYFIKVENYLHHKHVKILYDHWSDTLDAKYKEHRKEIKKKEREEKKKFLGIEKAKEDIINKYGKKYGAAVIDKKLVKGMTQEMMELVIGAPVYVDNERCYFGRPFERVIVFKNNKLVKDEALDKSIWIDMTKAMLLASWGEPGNTKEQVSKKNTKLKFYYGAKITRQKTITYDREVRLVNDLVVGWKDL